MFLIHLESKTFLYQESEFSMENQMAWRSDLPMMNTINMTLKNLTEFRQMTLNDPKFDIKKFLDTLVKLPAASECYCSYYGLKFITWKYNIMNKSWLWLQNWRRQTCNLQPTFFCLYLLSLSLYLSVIFYKCNCKLLVWVICKAFFEKIDKNDI